MLRLKAQGKDVRVGFYHAAKSPLVLSGSRGKTICKGFTTCRISVEQDNPEVMFGTAFCSDRDVFNKEKGRKVSLTKALSFYPKEFRREIWEGYFGRAE